MGEAIIESCRVRLRPILMTSLATIIGLLPMAMKLGEGSESYAPLARALIGGLLVSVVAHSVPGSRRLFSGVPQSSQGLGRCCSLQNRHLDNREFAAIVI